MHPLDLTGLYWCSNYVKNTHHHQLLLQRFSVSFPNRTLGQIKISLSDSTTRNLKSGRYGYDLLIQDSSGLRTRVIEGSALVTAGNTTSI